MKKSKLYWVLLSALCLVACSPQSRVSRLLHRHPELAACDTLTLTDTLVTQTVKADTMVCIRELYDTLYLERGRLEMAVSRIADTIYVTGRCKADTVVITRRMAVERIRLVKPDNKAALIAKLPWIIGGIMAVCMVLVVLLVKKW
jgi:hypothetical protein